MTISHQSKKSPGGNLAMLYLSTSSTPYHYFLSRQRLYKQIKSFITTSVLFRTQTIIYCVLQRATTYLLNCFLSVFEFWFSEHRFIMQVRSPPLPFVAPIGGHLVPGSKITIVGWPLEKCTSFRINLKLGPAGTDEIALHLSARFRPSVKAPVVIRNTHTSAGWGVEENETPIFPFAIKETYKLEILCEQARYRISVDDILLAVYTHRLPLAYVSHLEIEGDTEISYVEIPRIHRELEEYGWNTSHVTMKSLSIGDDCEENN